MKFKVLKGAALAKYLKTHAKLRASLAKAHARALVLRVRVRVKHPRPKRSLSHRALLLAAHYVGTKEYPAGSNVTLFGRWYGEVGVPWCAIFVSYILSHTGRPFKYAYVPNIVDDARHYRNKLRPIKPSEVNAAIAKGHPVLACYDWTGDGTADHVGFARWVKDGMVYATEGNTGDSNWSNGGEVLREQRPLNLVQQFVEVLP